MNIINAKVYSDSGAQKVVCITVIMGRSCSQVVKISEMAYKGFMVYVGSVESCTWILRESDGFNHVIRHAEKA